MRNRFVSRLLLVQALASLATGATGAMLVVLAERHLGLPAAGFAWLIGAIGVGAVSDAMRGRVFTLLDVTWSAMRLISLAIGGLVLDAIGIQALFWGGGTMLAVAGLLGLLLLGRHDFRHT